ncbi:DUF397 domain-containing protein [Actinocatenispora thailandica]|uniref:DUF397 domain-containing protein n=1 Tax=Actinocatenispora thailandica TaxID=227318 RepID=A0A7R7DQB6_9ACTN|nr:DUF397 domain-containing protein [Actinocatenispora thailandica]BCJ35849.1 DUF397 domain-containing protein [Actinocatenispora thailandica]
MSTDATPLRWWKSSRSGAQGGQCVEVASAKGRWYVRDSKDPVGGVLRVDAAQWGAFLGTVRHGIPAAGFTPGR